MTEELTKEEIARVFAMYQGQKVLCFPSDDMMPYWLTPTVLEWNVIAGSFYSVTNTILALTPLSCITDEHAIEVAKICTGLQDGWNIGAARGDYWRYIERADKGSLEVRIFFKQLHIIVCNVFANSVSNSENPLAWMAIQFLIQQGYTVPLFFGLNHWANGKTAIQLGIAIAK